ncbi:hypothetical protein ACLB2K_050692 [Fragaria x ananassa]
MLVTPGIPNPQSLHEKHPKIIRIQHSPLLEFTKKSKELNPQILVCFINQQLRPPCLTLQKLNLLPHVFPQLDFFDRKNVQKRRDFLIQVMEMAFWRSSRSLLDWEQ